MTIAPWTFAQRPRAPRQATVTLIVFGEPTEELPMSLARFGIPTAAAAAACDVRRFARAEERAWFDGWRTGSLRAIATIDLGAALATLDAADVLHTISVEIDGPADLSYLQAAWGLARWFAARGATTVLDAHAMTFTPAAALPPAGGPLDVAHEVRVIYETESTRPDQAHAIHTRGLRKFGAPDLVALCRDDDVKLVGSALAELADSIARGLDLGVPRHRVDVMPGVAWAVVPDEHGLGALLQLNNTARVLVDADGHDLVGVADRLRRAPS